MSNPDYRKLLKNSGYGKFRRIMSPRRYAVTVIGAIAFNLAAWSSVHSQIANPGAQISGTVTFGDCVKMGPGVGQIQDAGAACTPGFTPSAATQSNDTNVTLTLTGTPATALLQAVNFQMGWTGTLAAARLNANVVQAFTNDTNIQASISAQNATLAWAGTLAVARGGSGAGTQAGAAINLFPTPTRAGDVVYWNGTNWVTLAGNNSGTAVLQETSAGVPSWVTAGTGTVTQIIIAQGAGITVSGTCTVTTTGTCTVAITPGAVPGVATNTTASAGNVGEYISANLASGSAITLTTNVAANVTSVSLTAGDWDCRGNVSSQFSAGITALAAWISTTSATDPGAPNSGGYTEYSYQTQQAAIDNMVAPIASMQFLLASTTTVFLGTRQVFPSGTDKAFGFIGCRRMR
jgi:hypothetical protein